MNSEPAPPEAAAAPAQDRPMRPFFILWGGQSISLLGSQAVQFALIWWLTAETGSATVLATAAILGLLPQSLLGPFIGALVDRWNRKRIMLVADSAIAAASALLAWSFFFEAATVTHVMTLLFARAVGSAFHRPAMIWGGFKRRIYTAFAALLGAGLGTLLVGGASTWKIALVGFVVLGVMAPLINGPIHAVLQMTVPPDMQGRVFASYTSLATLMTPVGLVLAAPVADLLGIRALYLAGGTACLVMGVGGFVTPAIAKIEDQPSAVN